MHLIISVRHASMMMLHFNKSEQFSGMKKAFIGDSNGHWRRYILAFLASNVYAPDSLDLSGHIQALKGRE